MSSEKQTDDSELEETVVRGYSASIRSNLVKRPTTRRVSKDKVVSPRLDRSRRKLEHKRRSLNNEKPSQESQRDLSNYHNPKTGKTNAGGSCPPKSGHGELIRYMSDVPCYLQHIKIRDTDQKKALNFGVINWGRLENWAYSEKFEVNDSEGYSPSIRDASSTFSPSESSSETISVSCKSVRSSPAHRKKPLSQNDHSVSSVLGSRVRNTENDSSRHVTGFPDSRISLRSTSLRHQQFSEMDGYVSANHSENQYLHAKRKDSNLKITPCSMSQPTDGNILVPNSKEYDTSNVGGQKVKVRHSGLRDTTESNRYEQEICETSFIFSRDSSQDQCTTKIPTENHSNAGGHEVKVRPSRLRDAAESNHYAQEECESSFSFSRDSPQDQYTTKNPIENCALSIISPGIPRSSPLLSTTRSDQREAASIPLSDINRTVIKPKRKNQRQNQIAAQSVVGIVDRMGQEEQKASNISGRELSHNHLSSAGPRLMNRSSSLTEGSKIRQRIQTDCPDNSHGDKATAHNKGRQSPLRRMLDMLPKSKNHISLSGPMVASYNHATNKALAADRSPIMERSVSGHGPCKSFSGTLNPSTSQERENLNSAQTSRISLDSVQDERPVQPTRHAILRLTEKNGTNLLILSSNDNNILAATIRKKVVSDKDSQCIYTISSAHEVKKKSGIWTNHGNKSKKHPLVSNVVAQLKVSGYKTIISDSKAHSVVVEFVLSGAEQIPAPDESINATFNRELASIIVNIPKQDCEGLFGDVFKSVKHSESLERNHIEKQSGHQAGSLQIEQNMENLSLSSITVLLPSGVHGLSVEGGPSPLINRWRSGGACDCGGWDEGCNIAVLYLHDKVQECISYCDAHLRSSTYDTDQIELFVQGGSGENGHFFSMISCREGLYMVDFTESIALLQAFAICIATLYSRKPANHTMVQDSVECRTFEEHIFSNNNKMVPAKPQGKFPGFVVQHRPFSPVGRA